MHRFVRALGAVMGLGLVGCGGVTVREVSPASAHALPAMTIERLQACTDEFGGQLEPGRYDVHPVVKVDTDGIVRGVELTEIPRTAHDLAACMRIALGDMAIPASVFNLRPTQSASTDKPTAEQRSYIGNPVVVVVVVVEVGEIILEAGAITILFATTVKVVEKAADDVAELAKQRRIWRDQCTDDYTGCIASPAGRARGNHWNMTRCGTCREVCERSGKWPSHVPMFPEDAVSCY